MVPSPTHLASSKHVPPPKNKIKMEFWQKFWKIASFQPRCIYFWPNFCLCDDASVCIRVIFSTSRQISFSIWFAFAKKCYPSVSLFEIHIWITMHEQIRMIAAQKIDLISIIWKIWTQTNSTLKKTVCFCSIVSTMDLLQFDTIYTYMERTYVLLKTSNWKTEAFEIGIFYAFTIQKNNTYIENILKSCTVYTIRIQYSEHIAKQNKYKTKLKTNHINLFLHCKTVKRNQNGTAKT